MVNTEVISGRGYGIKLSVRPTQSSRDSNLVFYSPSRLAMGLLAVLDKDAITNSVEKYARRTGVPEDEVADMVRALEHGVLKKYGSVDLIHAAGTLPPVIRNAVNHAGKLAANVWHSDGWYRQAALHISEESNPLFRFSAAADVCDDYKFGVQKSGPRGSVVCTHTAQIMMANQLDNASQLPASRNRTNLFPSERPEHVLPFNMSAYAAEAWVARFVDGRTYHDIDCDVLSRPGVLTPEMEEALERSRLNGPRARFTVLRNAANGKNGATSTRERQYASVRSLVGQIEEAAERGPRRFYEEGYSRAFIGTPRETITRRFRHDAEVIELATWADHPPVLVHRSLREYRGRDVSEVDSRSPLERTSGTNRDAVDPTTRRAADEQILLPTSFASVPLETSQILQAWYREIDPTTERAFEAARKQRRQVV